MGERFLLVALRVWGLGQQCSQPCLWRPQQALVLFSLGDSFLLLTTLVSLTFCPMCLLALCPPPGGRRNFTSPFLGFQSPALAGPFSILSVLPAGLRGSSGPPQHPRGRSPILRQPAGLSDPPGGRKGGQTTVEVGKD